MQSIIIISAILASAVAAPGYLLAEEAHVYHTAPLSKSTYTQNSQVIDHGSTYHIHAPVVHHVASSKTTITKANQIVNHGGSTVLHPVHAYEVMPVHGVYHVPSKTTITKNSQTVNHGGTAIVHAPVVHEHVVHAPVVHEHVVHAPVVHSSVVHTPVVYHSSPLVSVKSGGSAITHHSSTVHETVPVVAVHH